MVSVLDLRLLLVVGSGLAGRGLSRSNRGPVALCTLGLGLLNPPGYILEWSVNRVPACLARSGVRSLVSGNR